VECIFLLSTSSCVCGCGDIVSNGERYLLCTIRNGVISCTMWNDKMQMTNTAKMRIRTRGEKCVVGRGVFVKVNVCDWAQK
jgi:hypothetical protein